MCDVTIGIKFILFFKLCAVDLLLRSFDMETNITSCD